LLTPGCRDVFGTEPNWDEVEDLLRQYDLRLVVKALTRLMSFLENEEIDHGIAESLAKRLDDSADDINLVTALIRGLSYTKAKSIRETSYRKVLENPARASGIEVLAAIAGRAWEMLHDDEFCDRYLTALAANSSGQEAFDHCLEDLLFIPGMKKPVKASLKRIGEQDAASGKVVQLFEGKYSGQRKPDASDT